MREQTERSCRLGSTRQYGHFLHHASHICAFLTAVKMSSQPIDGVRRSSRISSRIPTALHSSYLSVFPTYLSACSIALAGTCVEHNAKHAVRLLRRRATYPSSTLGFPRSGDTAKPCVDPKEASHSYLPSHCLCPGPGERTVCYSTMVRNPAFWRY